MARLERSRRIRYTYPRLPPRDPVMPMSLLSSRCLAENAHAFLSISARANNMPSRQQRRLAKLVNQYVGFVERVLRNMGVGEDDLDDAVQRTFIVVANRLDDIVVGAERSFLFKSAKHMASHVRRSRARFERHEPLDEQLPCDGESPEQLITQKKARELLDEILEGMPEDLRVVFSLYEFEDLTMQEIASLLEIPTGTVASRLRRSREHFHAQVRRIQAASTRPMRRRVGS